MTEQQKQNSEINFDEINDFFDNAGEALQDRFESDPHASHVLQQLGRLRSLTAEVSKRSSAAIETSADWWEQLTTLIIADSRPGRVIPLGKATESQELGITEGAVKALIRDASDAIESCLVTKIELPAEITEPGAQITVKLRASVASDVSVKPAADAIRAAVSKKLKTHTTLDIAAIDVQVSDVVVFPTNPAGENNE
ncbi:hypothetical protein [Canibacter zhoujuaniae]|uniref:hypothetical protein n=1 Tax=Canibacter zhoujuaniae TaxID=2708343 RepID=UPI0014243555|nr:hypothetical protein [Canibacter zhoujuaniae]